MSKAILICFAILLIMITFMLWIDVVFADEIDDIIPFIIKVESNGDPNAIGTSGEIGLMQISPIVFKEYNNVMTDEYEVRKKNWHKRMREYREANPDMMHNFDVFMSIPSTIALVELWDKRININVGGWYLRRLKDHYLKDVCIIYCGDGKNRKNLQVATLYSDYIEVNWEKILYIKTVQDYELALILAGYNGGITRLKKVNYDINKMPKSTQRYVKKVLKLYKESL